MKKLFITFLSALFVSQFAFAGNIEVLPTMQSKTTEQDRVWVGTFQLVWNDFMDKFVHDIVKFADVTPETAKELNEQAFLASDISSNCFYKYAGRVTKNTKKIIETAIQKKFNEKSDILKNLDMSPDPNKFIIYAMLKKDFKFVQAFDNLGKSDFKNSKANYFGITKRSDELLRDSVTVLFYNSDSDFAVKLNAVGGDEVYLYKTKCANQFNYIYSDMQKKQNHYNGTAKLADIDELKIPDLKFFEETEFTELEGKRVKGTRLQIDKALETVKFDMNNEGVKLKSEAAMTMLKTALPDTKLKPRHYYFDDTFVLFLKEKNSSKPYFALRVYDITKFQ